MKKKLLQNIKKIEKIENKVITFGGHFYSFYGGKSLIKILDLLFFKHFRKNINSNYFSLFCKILENMGTDLLAKKQHKMKIFNSK